MGCYKTNNSNRPNLHLEFERGNNEQRAYVQKVIDNFQCEKKINFKQSDKLNAFKITLEVHKERHVIEDYYDGSPTKMNEALNRIYSLLK